MCQGYTAKHNCTGSADRVELHTAGAGELSSCLSPRRALARRGFTEEQIDGRPRRQTKPRPASPGLVISGPESESDAVKVMTSTLPGLIQLD
jgi:hypothetical protein